MRKILSAAVVFFCFWIALLPLQAAAIDFDVNTAYKVYDYADLFTDEEESRLSDEANLYSREYNLDFVIVTTGDDEGISSQDYAQDFYDYNAFQTNGILLLINMDERELWICGTGSGEYIFHDGQIESILDKIYRYASEGRYYETADAFLETSSKVAERATESAFSRNLRRLPFFLLIGAAAGGISVACMVSAGKLRRKGVEASAYTTKDGLRLTHRQDRFLRSAVTRTRIEQNSGSRSGRGGGGHIGSSGRSHSGGGRKF